MDPEAFKQYLAALSEQYRASLSEKLAHIEHFWAMLSAGSTAAGPMAALHRELHSLAGSAKTFGLPEVSEAARAAEFFIEPYCLVGALPAAPTLAEFEHLLAELKRKASVAPDGDAVTRRVR